MIGIDILLCISFLPPHPIFPNSYMLDSHQTSKKKDGVG